MEAQKAQSAILNKLSETKNFDTINMRKRVERQIEVQLQAQTRMLVKQKWSYCSPWHLLRQCPVYGKIMQHAKRSTTTKEVCRSRRNKQVHSTDQATDPYQKEDYIYTVNINSINFNSISIQFNLMQIYIAHWEDCICLIYCASQSFLHRPLFPYCVIPSWGVATPSQINSLGSIQVCYLRWSSASFYCLALQCSTCTYTHS